MWVIVALMWVPWIAFGAWLTRQVALRRSINEGRTAEEVVRRNYARGDINRERFMQLMADLGAGGGGASPTESVTS